MLDIKKYLKQTKTVLLTQNAFDELVKASAQPERKTGRWVSVGCVVPDIANVPMIKCNVCEHLEPDVDAARTPYCPYCGADMRGDTDDN